MMPSGSSSDWATVRGFDRGTDQTSILRLGCLPDSFNEAVSA